MYDLVKKMHLEKCERLTNKKSHLMGVWVVKLAKFIGIIVKEKIARNSFEIFRTLSLYISKREKGEEKS